MDTVVPDPGEMVESIHTFGYTSARSSRVEGLLRAERQRSWSAEQKLAILGESLDLSSYNAGRALDDTLEACAGRCSAGRYVLTFGFIETLQNLI